MKIAALQLDIAWEDREQNYARVRAHAARARDAGAEVLVLPEMFATGFSMVPAVTAEDPRGPTDAFVRELARDHGMAVIAGLVHHGQSPGKGRNVALAVDSQGADLALYAKAHLFTFLDEHHHHEPGDGPVPFTLGGVGAACFVCYDLRFPELFRLVADRSALMFLIASWPEVRQHHFDLLIRARAVENQVFFVGVNRVGPGGGLDFTGGTAIIDPGGEIVARAPDNTEHLLIADIDTDRVAELRAAMPVLDDRRF